MLRAGVVVFVVAIAAVVAVRAEPPEIRLTPEDRTALQVTVYGGGLAMISDRRTAVIESGEARLAFEGVSREVLPATCLLTGEGGLRVQSLGHDSDVLTPEALLRRSVGRIVGVVRTHPTTGEETLERATLLSAEAGVVLLYRDRIETGFPGRIVFFEAPADLRALPTLVATVSSDGGGEREVELSCLTEGLSWNADYVAEIHPSEDRIDVDGRVTLTNATSIDFLDASVAVVAGDIRRVSPPGVARTRMAMMAADAAEEGMSFPERQALGDLHLYALARALSLGARETKQVGLLSAAGLVLDREYVSEAGAMVFRPVGERPLTDNPKVVLRFRNEQVPGWSEPLPAGIVQVYLRDGDGVRRLLGEDRIPPTPAGEPVEISPGQAFDITVKRTQTEFVRAGLSDRVFESAYRIDLTNAKRREVTVKVVEVIPGDWRILAESLAHTREAADLALWRVAVPAGGSASLTYRVRVQQ